MLLKFAIPLFSVSVSLFRVKLGLLNLCNTNTYFQKETFSNIENTLKLLPNFLDEIDNIEKSSLNFISEKHVTEININTLLEEYVIDSACHFKQITSQDNLLKNVIYYKKLHEIYDDDDFFLKYRRKEEKIPAV